MQSKEVDVPQVHKLEEVFTLAYLVSNTEILKN